MLHQYLKELKEALQEQLPELAEGLNPPAAEAELLEAEGELGVSLPEELRALYLLHDGEREEGPGLFFGLRFLSLQDMLVQWRVWAELEGDFEEMGDHYSVPAGWVQERYINRRWLPLAEDGGGNHIGVDLDPGERGRTGQIINFGRDEEVKYVIALQLGDLLQFMRDAVRNGDYTVHREDEFVHWDYGRDSEEGHFLDGIRSLPLPVLHPAVQELEQPESGSWFAALDDAWQQRVRAKAATPEKFTAAKQLYFIGEKLTDLGPLGLCGDLRELVLSGNEIRELDALKGCTGLKKLYLGGNPVSNLSPLSGLPALQQLNLARTPVSDLTPLASCPKLRELDLQGAPVEDFTPLLGVKSLRSLEVTVTDAEQLRSLTGLRQLQHLKLSGLRAIPESELALLGKLAKLQTLELEDAELTQLDFLLPCRRLTGLTLTGTSAADISALTQLPELREVKLSGSEAVGRLETLAEAPALQKFSGSFAQFRLLSSRVQQRQVDFSTIIGEMTEEQSREWQDYLRESW